MSGPITAAEMAGYVQRGVDMLFPGVPEAAGGDSFEMTASATGQRFRVTVTEVDGWSDQMDAELDELTRAEKQS